MEGEEKISQTVKKTKRSQSRTAACKESWFVRAAEPSPARGASGLGVALDPSLRVLCASGCCEPGTARGPVIMAFLSSDAAPIHPESTPARSKTQPVYAKAGVSTHPS